jgi:hypothetical protein
VVFVARSVAEGTDGVDPGAVSELVRSITQVRTRCMYVLSCTHTNAHQLPEEPNIRRIVLLALGAYSEWLHDNPALLTDALPIVIQGLSSHPAAAAMSLRDLCDTCAVHMTGWTGEILTHCMALLHGTDSSMLLKDRLRMFDALGRLISRVPVADVLEKLQQLMSPCIDSITRLKHFRDGASFLSNRLRM